MPTFAKEEIGVKIQPAELVALLNDMTHGGFCHIAGYVNEAGEVADHYLQAGINYGNIQAKSRTIVQDWLTALRADEAPATMPVIEVRYKTWIGEDGLENNRKANGRVRKEVEKTLDPTNPAHRAELVAALTELDNRYDPARPRQKGADYQKEATGLYSLDRQDGKMMFYFRDCIRLHKKVWVEGDYSSETTGAETGFSTGEKALLKAIEAHLPVGHVRQYKFVIDLTEGKAGCGFNSLTIDGQSLLVGNPLAGEIWLALPTFAKQVMTNPAMAGVLAEAEAAEPVL